MQNLITHCTVRPLYLALLAPFIIVGLLYTFEPSLRDGLGSMLTGGTPHEEIAAPLIKEDVLPPEVLAGTIQLSLAPTTTERYIRRSLYTYDISTGELTPSLKEDSVDYYEPSLSQDGEMIVFASSPVGVLDQTLFFGSSTLADLFKINRPDGVAHVRMPAISPRGSKIAFVGLTKRNDSFFDIGGQAVFLFDSLTGSTTKIADDAVSPLFVTENEILFVQRDGVYMLDLTRSVSTLIIPTEDTRYGYDQLALSSDGKRLALAFPSRRQVVVYTVQSFVPYVAEPLISFTTFASEIAFSPRGRFLATTEFDVVSENGKETDVNQRLVVRDLESDNHKGLLSLTRFYPHLTNIGGWSY